MRKLLLLLIMSTFIYGIKVKAESASILYEKYGISGDTEIVKIKNDYIKLKTNYLNVDKSIRQQEYLNSSISDLDLVEVSEEYEKCIEELDSISSSSIDKFYMTIRNINKIDNNVIYLKDRIKYLETILFNTKIDKEENTDVDINKLFSKFKSKEKEYENAKEKDDIGTISLLVHPVQQKFKIYKNLNTFICIKADKGVGVLSMFNGEVVYGGYNKNNGETVIIDHGNDIYTEYNFLDARYVKKGMLVKQYQKIGNAGSKGYIRVKLKIKDKYYDPSILFITNKEGKNK